MQRKVNVVNAKFIKKLLSISIVVLMILVSFGVFFVDTVKAQPPSPNVITILPQLENVTIGDTFFTLIDVNVSWEINNVTLTNITFEPGGTLNYTSTTMGDLFSGGDWWTPDSNGTSDNASGYAYNLTWINSTSIDLSGGTGIFANITWYAYNVGTVEINLTGTTRYDSGTNYSTDTQNVTIYVHPQEVTSFSATTLTDTKIRLNFTHGIGSDNIVIRRLTGMDPPVNITDGTEVYNGTSTSYVDSNLEQDAIYSYSAWGWNSTENLYSLYPNSTGSGTYQGGSRWFLHEYSSNVNPRYIENGTQQKFNFSIVSETGGFPLRLHNLTIILPQNLTFEGDNGTNLQNPGEYTVYNTSNLIYWNATDYATGFLFDGTKNFWFNTSALGGLESLQFQIIAYTNYSEYQSFFMSVFLTTNFSFNGSVMDINGNPLVGATANITVYSFTQGPPVTIGYFTDDTDATGEFNVTGIPTTEENVSGLQSGPRGPGGGGDLFYSLFAGEYDATNTYAINISTSLPSLPVGEFVTMLNNPQIYLKPAISFRVNITGPNYNWSSKQIENYSLKNFQMMVKDLKLGFPVKEINTRSYEQIFSVPASRNYSLSIFPDQSFPVSIRFYNITSMCEAGGDLNQTGVLVDYSPYNGTYLLNVSVNVSYNHRWLNGSFNDISDIADMRVVVYIMEDQDMVFENWALPFNLANESGGNDDSYNTATGDYNISLPATMASSYIVLRAYAKTNPGVYYMGSHIINSSGGDLNESIHNFTMSPLINGINRSIVSNNVSANWNETILVNTTAVLFNMVNDSGSLLSNENAFIEIKRELEGTDYMQMIDAENGQFNISLTQGSSLKKLTIYSQQYAPVSTYVSANVISGSESTDTISCSNGVCNITLRSFGDFDPLGENASITMELFKSNSTCNVPNPPPFCSLCAGQNKTGFSPFNAILAGDTSMMISSGNISVYYLNVDLLASGPPDAAFTQNATEAQGGLEAAWQFGSQGPDIYDAVLIKMPYDDSLHNRTINVTIPVLYDNEFNIIWNSSINSTSDILTDPRLSDYTDYLSASYEAYLNGMGVICNESDSTLSSGIGYKDKTNRTIWIKILHFSGVGPLIVGDAPDPPSSFTATKSGTSQIDLSWTKDSKADYTHVRRKTGSYPTSISDGTNVTNTTGNSKSDTGLTAGTKYYYSAWSWNITEALWSTSYATSSATTDSDGDGGNGGTPPTNIHPTADADGPYSGYINTTIQFDGSGSTDSDGTISSYSWSYGDGATGTGMISNHTYTAVGNYTVTLTVTDNGGLTDTDTSTVTIEEEPTVDNPPEIPSVTHTPAKVTSEDNVTISAEVTDDYGISSVVLYWDNGSVVQYKTMNNDQGDIYSAFIGSFPEENTITYWIKATDTNNQNRTSSSKSFTVYAPPISENVGNVTEEGKEIVIEGSDINNINFKPTKELQNVNITIENVTEDEILDIKYTGDGVVLKYLNITITSNDTYVEDDDIDSLKIKFKVEIAWLNNENIDKENVSLMRYHNDAWEMLDTSYLTEDDTYVYYEATMSGLSTFAIVGTKITIIKEPTPAPGINYVYIILAVIAIIILIIAILFKTGFLYIEEEKQEEKSEKKTKSRKKTKK